MLSKLSGVLSREELLEKCAFRASLLFCCAFSSVFIVRSGTSIGGRAYFTLFDDAMISMRYAQNLAAGNGLTWNIGGEKIEGFTNLFWTLWMALLHLLPVHESKIPLLVMLSCAAILMLNLCAVRQLLREHGASPFVQLLALPCVALYYPLYFWTLRGMEVGLLTLLLNLALLLGYRMVQKITTRRLAFLCAVLCAGALTRTDFIPPALVISAAAGLLCEKGFRLKIFCVLAGTLLLSFSAHALFSFFYFGDFLPNTYYLKLTGVTLEERLARGLAMSAALIRDHLAAVLVFAPCMLALLKERTRKNVLFPLVLGILCAMHFMYSVYVGGDAWEWMGYANRYVTPAVPLLFILVALGLDRLLRSAPRMPACASGAIAVCLCLLWTTCISGPHYRRWLTDNCCHMYDDLGWMRLGVWIAKSTAPDTSIGVFCAGSIPYFAHRTAIDFLGKMDRTIAAGPARFALYNGHAGLSRFYPGHNKWNYEYSIGELQPDLIAQVWRTGTAPNLNERIIGWGYRQIGQDLFVKSSSAAKIDLRGFEPQQPEPKDLLRQLRADFRKSRPAVPVRVDGRGPGAPEL